MRIWRLIAVLFTSALLFGNSARAADEKTLETAIFAGGCFWCVESDFDSVPGVVETVSGYTGGRTPNPTYREVAGKGTGHREAVRIKYDPAVVSYEMLLTAFWRSVDPTDAGGQFCDRGEPYYSAIFVLGADQREAAEASQKAAEADLGKKTATTIEDASIFYPAEDYHQDYYLKKPLQYKFYRWRCGRNERVQDVWGKQAYTGIPGHS